MGNEVNLIEGVYISLSSMSLVFIILLIISFVLSNFKHIFKGNNNLAYESNNQSDKELALTDEDDEEKIVAALAASIMVGKGKINPNLHIKRITRIK